VQATLAVKAANAEMAIGSVLRGDYDEWVRCALRQGLEACSELLAGINAKPGVFNFFSHPETHGGLQFLRQEFPAEECQRRQLEEIRKTLQSLESEVKPSPALRRLMKEHQTFFEALSRQLASDDELERRLSMEA